MSGGPHQTCISDLARRACELAGCAISFERIAVDELRWRLDADSARRCAGLLSRADETGEAWVVGVDVSGSRQVSVATTLATALAEFCAHLESAGRN